MAAHLRETSVVGSGSLVHAGCVILEGEAGHDVHESA